jgi:preprotein translocase subunit SecG
MVTTLITVIHVITSLFMILVVLLQGGNSGGVGAAFGGGNSSGFFGATGATSLLGKLTYAGAAVFMMTSLSLTFLEGRMGNINLEQRLQERLKSEKKVEEAVPSMEIAPELEDAPVQEQEAPKTEN